MPPKLGDICKLGPWEWKVDWVDNKSFAVKRKDSGFESIRFLMEDAPLLEWIKPGVKFSKEQNAEIKKCWAGPCPVHKDHDPCLSKFFACIDAHTESGEEE